MSYRGRPVNCRLYYEEVKDKLDDWIKAQIVDGNVDDYIWDRLDQMSGVEFYRTFGKLVEGFIADGAFDGAVEKQAKELGYEKQ